MSYLRRALVYVGLAAFLVAGAAGQQGSPASLTRPSASAPPVSVNEEFIHKQFGEEFSLLPMSMPMVRDLDGDGVDDFVIVAKCKKPLLDAAEHAYRVIDPYFEYLGYGDPRLTASFGSEELLEKYQVVLIIHGAGTDGWRSDTPKAKFVIINLPFKKVTLRRLQLRKRLVNAIFAEESNSTAGDSVIFWDGRQYRYQPIGTGNGDD
jgi:hypothetical protein